MNRLQKTELELLRNLIDVCGKLELRYYLVCGSALGAVKYGGFIPWDDDIDVGMPREDYRTFIERAGEFLPSWCFLQTYATDPEYPQIFAKLRDSRTAYIERSMRHRNIHQGVFIDVFPLDGCPAQASEIKRLERKKRRYKIRLDSANAFEKGQKITTGLYFLALRALGYHRRTASTARKLEELVSAYPTGSSAVWCNHGNWQGMKEYAPREQYGEGTEMTFEGFAVTVPAEYDAYLTQKYGDWRADLPEEEKVGHHFYTVCDLEHPYTEYF